MVPAELVVDAYRENLSSLDIVDHGPAGNETAASTTE